MPQTLTKSSSILGIRLDGSQTSYTPGDTVTGCVFRRHQTVSPDASLTICLNGRAKSLIIISVLNSAANRYRGRYNLINTSRNTHNIFQGPIHIAEQGQEQVWPFSIKIPTNVDPTALDPPSNNQSQLLFGAGPLPSTFNVETHGNRSSTIGFVEYFLRAELQLTSQGSVDVTEALLPLKVQNLHPHPPIVDFQLQAFQSVRGVSSYRLVPGSENTVLTFSQRTKRLFGSSKAPSFWLKAHIDFPSVIQLENPNPVPFMIRLAPEWSKCSEILRGVPQKFKLTRFFMRIVARTEMSGEGTTNPHAADASQELDLDPMSAIKELGEDIFIHCADESPAVDIGEMINLRIGNQGRLGQQSPCILNPSFKTYNIHHTHSLTWGVGIEVAGENIMIHASKPLVVLPPSDEERAVSNTPTAVPSKGASTHMQPQETSESWIRPPDDDPAPPSFAQAQEDDLVRKPSVDGESKKPRE